MPPETDTPATESNAPLSINEAASFFDSALSGTAKEPEKKPETATAAAEPSAAAPSQDAKAAAEKPEATEQQVDASAQEAQKVTIEVDGKTVELTPQQIAEAYKNGLRQEDYTKKTMATAEQRKAAEAEAAKARQAREQYAGGLQQAQAILQAQLHEQSQTVNWQDLLDNNPQEYLKQRHLADARQAKLNEVTAAQRQLFQQHQAEQAQQFALHMQAQQDAILAKLPHWKDQGKREAEQAQIREYLKTQGYEDGVLDSVSDNRAVLIAHKAMLYDQLMGKADAASKKVSALPSKVERPGVSETTGLDGRTATWKRFEKSGSVNDAAKVFASLL